MLIQFLLTYSHYLLTLFTLVSYLSILNVYTVVYVACNVFNVFVLVCVTNSLLIWLAQCHGHYQPTDYIMWQAGLGKV